MPEHLDSKRQIFNTFADVGERMVNLFSGPQRQPSLEELREIKRKLVRASRINGGVAFASAAIYFQLSSTLDLSAATNAAIAFESTVGLFLISSAACIFRVSQEALINEKIQALSKQDSTRDLRDISSF